MEPLTASSLSVKLAGIETGLQQFVLEQKSRILAIEQKLTAPGGISYGGGELNDIGRKLIESDGYKNLTGNNAKTTGRIPVGTFYERKSTIVSGSGTGQVLVAPEFRPGVVGPGQQRITLRDLMPNIPTQSNLIEFTRENSHSDATAIQAVEGDPKGESALGFELAYVPVRTIASWIPCSVQILNDAPALQNYVNGRLMYFNALKIENEILNGSGVGTEISGLRTQATAFDTTRVNPATDTFIDVLGIALSQAAESLFDPDAVVLNPKDWSRIQRIKTATTNEYIFADPHSGGGKVLWGVTVVPSWSIPESQFLVGSFAMGAAVWDRQQASVEVSREHADFFVRNLAAILCESRLAVTVYRPDAFVQGGFPFGS
jgi:HK97 family phage major capsid protein